MTWLARFMICLEWLIPCTTPQGYCRPLTLRPATSSTVLLPTTANGILAFSSLSCSLNSSSSSLSQSGNSYICKNEKYTSERIRRFRSFLIFPWSKTIEYCSINLQVNSHKDNKRIFRVSLQQQKKNLVG